MFVPLDAPAHVEQRIAEAAARLPIGGVVTGWAALRLAGGSFFDGTSDGRTQLNVDLIVPPTANLRPVAGIVRHRQLVRPEDLCRLQGIKCTVASRAVFDAMAAAGSIRQRVRVADMALSAGLVTRAALIQRLEASPRPVAVRKIEEALQYAEDRTRSPWETDLRLTWMIDAGLPRPLCNWPVSDHEGRFLGSPDLLCEQLGVVGEFDGAEHRSLGQQAEDARRDAAFADAGLECFRVVARDFHQGNIVVDRMLAAVRRARQTPRPRRWMRATNPPPLIRN